jgi:TRAP-type C4-dicarboxylate transport system permease small subunit
VGGGDSFMKLIARLMIIIFDGAMAVMAFLAGVLLVLTVILVTAAVVFRYFFHSPIGWSVEVTQYMLVFMGYLVVAWVLRREGHVKMDILLNAFSQTAQSLVNAITSAVGTVVCFIIALVGATVTRELYRTDYFEPTVLMVPKFIFLAAIALAFFMLSIQFARRTYGYLKKWGSQRSKGTGY